MDCQEVKSVLNPHLDGELSHADAAAIAAHLSACDGCRRSYEELRLVSTLIRTELTARETAAPGLVAKVMRAIAELPPAAPSEHASLRRTAWRRLRRRWIGPSTR